MGNFGVASCKPTPTGLTRDQLPIAPYSSHSDWFRFRPFFFL